MKPGLKIIKFDTAPEDRAVLHTALRQPAGARRQTA